MNAQRLTELRRVVLAAPDHLFHMRAWTEQAPCGTAHCAAGWAAVDPWFRENTEIGEIFRVDPNGCFIGFANRITSRLADLFDISGDNAGGLFAVFSARTLDPHDITKAEVVANIDRLLAGEDAEPYAATLEEDVEDDEEEDYRDFESYDEGYDLD